MKKMNMLICLICYFLSSVSYADVGSEFTSNVVKIQVKQQLNTKNQESENIYFFEYCIDKTQASTCSQLGKGWYTQKSIEHFKNMQLSKAIANGVIGGSATLLGGGWALTVGVVFLPFFVGGSAVAYAGIHMLYWTLKNIENINNLNKKILRDEYVDISYQPNIPYISPDDLAKQTPTEKLKRERLIASENAKRAPMSEKYVATYATALDKSLKRISALK